MALTRVFNRPERQGLTNSESGMFLESPKPHALVGTRVYYTPWYPDVMLQ